MVCGFLKIFSCLGFIVGFDVHLVGSNRGESRKNKGHFLTEGGITK